jgi:hypothetical protein
MNYEEVESFIIRTNDDGSVSWIPTDPSNSDYAEYLASLEATEPEAE